MAMACFFSLAPPPSPLLSPTRRTLAPRRPVAEAHGSTRTPVPDPKALTEIKRSRIIACLRAQDGLLAMEAARAAIRGGISVLEVVMSTPGALEVIRGLIQEHPSSTIGVGTVLNVADARKAVNAGAKFLMSPCTIMDVLLSVQGGDVLYIPGVMTPTEVLSAYNAGARIVKVYPVSALGGDKYISALSKPFPHIPMVVSQGITIDSIKRYIEGGASAVVLSDAIFEKEAMRERNFETISRLAQLATLHCSGVEK
ncbi:uncharacterized protein M6B38_293185 [Iris pallida]|uniref:KHG/KDPG aldolase n=1 Tax=Iris pallida TaxID=29817 RepID=A0AAX6HVI1_IRIPA|nr:uncharacterized protein M6B38_293185 [Iris pallida]